MMSFLRRLFVRDDRIDDLILDNRPRYRPGMSKPDGRYASAAGPAPRRKVPKTTKRLARNTA